MELRRRLMETLGLEIEVDAEMVKGSFTPEENILEAEFNVGVPFSFFVLYPTEDVTGNTKNGNTIIVDFDNSFASVTATNTGGTALGTIADIFGYNDTVDAMYFIANNTRITKTKATNTLKVSTSSAAGACFGHFKGGVTYNWIAW